MKVYFKSIWYNPKIDVLACPILLKGHYYYEYGNTGALRPILNVPDWEFIDFI